MRLATLWMARKFIGFPARIAVTSACNCSVSRTMACRYAAPSVGRSVASMGVLLKAFWANMATTSLTLVGNFVASRGLAECRDTVYCTAIG